MEYLVKLVKDGGEETHRIDDMSEEARIIKNGRARGFKHAGTTLNKNAKLTKSQTIEIMKQKAASSGPDAQDAQRWLRDEFMGVVEMAKAAGVFEQRGATFVKKDAATMGTASWQPREVVDDLGVSDDPASNPDDLSDVKGDYEGGANPVEFDEALVEWLSGKPAKARRLGLDDTTMEAMLHQRSAVPVRLTFGKDLQAASLGNAETAQGMDDAVEEIQPKSAGLRTPQKLSRPSSFGKGR